MQYALLGDIHSSIDDLQAVLNHISNESPHAELIGTGDLYECTVSKKKLHGQIYSSVNEVIQHPDSFDELLSFLSVYGNQEERILLITEQEEPLRNVLSNLPETLNAGRALVIHGHQWNPEERDSWLDENMPEEVLVFHGHTHQSSFTVDGNNIRIPVNGEVMLSGKRSVVNVGAVVESREWVLYDTVENTVKFMKAQKS
ncbi:metallophosphoesterase family protein [Sporosarcina obsidiansis]|uniref:metallophosphoesterase family protein n=1 Tax=Sporosarcina obsidiansis TaxID=2660748 RepID=UPI001890C5B6|nr:metallophosphoesterase family protein [Sporosarcina obsidiansis]